MGKGLRINLIGVAILLALESLSLGASLEDGDLPAKSPTEPVYSLWISTEKKSAFPLLDAGEGQKNFSDARRINLSAVNEIPMDVETDPGRKSPFPNGIPENNPMQIERDLLRKNNSGYRFHQIPFAETDLDPSLKIVSGLLVGQYEDPLSRGAETFKETDIIKSLTFLLQVNLQF
jgi:hypothetical protein